MPARDVLVLIPCHSLEDFPTEQSETPAAGLLNAMAVAWHPQLIVQTGQMPRWHRADDPPAPEAGMVVFIPEAANGWLPHDWPQQARDAGAVVIEGGTTRDELAEQAVGATAIAPEFIADFYALGTCWLLVELLTRHMRNFGNVDDVRLQNRVVGAAKATLANDAETARAHLQSAFEILLEARERFYPVDCYLIDLCLAIPDVLNVEFAAQLAECAPLNLLVTPSDLVEACAKTPELKAALTEAIQAGRVCLIGGEEREQPVPVVSAGTWLNEMERGIARYKELVGARPVIWGRRKYGLAPVLPGWLKRLGYLGAIHVVLDDGLYPDAEYSRFRWQSPDQTTIEAWSRIPLAAETAATYLRYPVRMAESMDQDHVAAIAFARWPAVKAPWWNDLQRSQKYAPVLGKFITLAELFEQGSSPGRLCAYESKEYFAPFLIQDVAYRERDPLSRPARRALQRLRFEAVDWCRSIVAAVHGRSLADTAADGLEASLDAATADADATLETRLLAATSTALQQFRGLVIAPGETAGFLVINPLGFTRRVQLSLPDLVSPPPISGGVKAVDWDASAPERRSVTVDVPGCGFAWIPRDGRGPLPEVPRKATPLKPATEPIIRHDRLELTLSPATGGIQQVRHPQRRENRFGQLVSYRYPRERQLPPREEGEPPTKSFYAETRCTGWELFSGTGGALEIRSRGEIVDQLTNEVLARFVQISRLLKYQPRIEIEVELSDVKVPDGDPWNQYFCLRFAWDDSAAAITRCLLDGAQGFGGERIETTEYLEIATESERLTIVPHGLPYHRKTGSRMLDTLLVVAGETARHFRCTVALDESYPLETARSVLSPVLVEPVTGTPRGGQTGWLLHLDARNVQLTQLREVHPWKVATDEGELPVEGPGFAVRLIETEGRSRPIRLRCFRQPLRARVVDLAGETVRELPIEDDSVMITLVEYEVADVELWFG